MSIVELKIQNTMRTKKRFFYEYLHEQQYIEQKTNEINTVDKAFLNYMEWNLLGAHLFIPLDSLCFFSRWLPLFRPSACFRQKYRIHTRKSQAKFVGNHWIFFFPANVRISTDIYNNAIALRCIVWRYFLVFMSFLFV